MEAGIAVRYYKYIKVYLWIALTGADGREALVMLYDGFRSMG
jgi:hypothetical protein